MFFYNFVYFHILNDTLTTEPFTYISSFKEWRFLIFVWESQIGKGYQILIHSQVHIDSQKQNKVSLALSDSNLAQKWGKPHFVTEIPGIATVLFFSLQMVLSSSMMGGVSPAMFAKTHLKPTLSWQHNRNRNL